MNNKTMLKCELNHHKRKIELIIGIVCVLASLLFIFITERTDNKFANELYLDSLKNNVIINDNVYYSMKEHLLSSYPKENVITLSGYYDNLTNKFNITNWKQVNVTKSTRMKVWFEYSYSDSNFIGTLHTHTSKYVTKHNCKLSHTDIMHFKRQKQKESEVRGLMCGDFHYIILFKPINNSKFERYVYMETGK